MEPDIDDFIEIFPEFKSISEVRLEYYYDLSINQVGQKAFGDCYAQAVYLMTAHNLTMADPTRSSNGEKSSEKVGDIAVSYNTSISGNDLDSYLNQTQYGKQFIQLRNTKVVSPTLVDC